MQECHRIAIRILNLDTDKTRAFWVRSFKRNTRFLELFLNGVEVLHENTQANHALRLSRGDVNGKFVGAHPKHDQVIPHGADTAEFADGEKKWLADKLPDKRYESADEALTALNP